ncbi:hypothetical protein DFH09DRAFT_899971 [Mycena vulgaris]|nr:hypothetical protein DFH09DRAFT_899971 [Mycena vulgaris]
MLYPESSFSPYTLDEEDKRLGVAPPRPESVPERPQQRGSIYRSISWILGFRDKYSLLNCFIWGGAMIGFCLARSVTMNPSQIANLLVPGEWFWFREPMYKVNIFIHIYLTTIGGIGALFQFFPAIRRRYVFIHRANGKYNPA